ncbi:MAG: glucans biosynthesis glucosyltransferase MdoH, partial [Roseovarius sp.]
MTELTPNRPTAPAVTPIAPHLRRAPALATRRRIVLALNVVTVAALFAAMFALFLPLGITWAEGAMLTAFLLTLPWLSIGLWNSILGLALDLRHGAAAAAHVTPALARIRGDEPITARVAVVMPLRNEDPDASIARLRRLEEEIARSPYAGRFSYHVLSDTDDARVALKEEARIAQWRAARPMAAI